MDSFSRMFVVLALGLLVRAVASRLCIMQSVERCPWVLGRIGKHAKCRARAAGTGNVVEAVRHARTLMREIKKLKTMDEDELYTYAKEIQVACIRAR